MDQPFTILLSKPWQRNAGALAVILLGIWQVSLAQCPTDCKCVPYQTPVTVVCSGLQLDTFPANISDKVKILDLSHNALRSVPQYALQEFSELLELSLAYNRLYALRPGWLHGTVHLQSLDLSHNPDLRLADLGVGALREAPLLRMLNLSGCAVDTLQGAKKYLDNPKLQVLDISRCQVNEVGDDEFLSALPNIQYLNLSGNPLKIITIFRSESLLHLNLGRSFLDSINLMSLRDLPSLRILDVSRNRKFAFRAFNTDVIMSESLQELWARFCELRHDDLKVFPNVQYANLQHNGFTSLWNSSFNNKFLAKLDLSNNNIQRIHPHTFNNVPKLQWLNLENNKIAHLHWNSFARTPDLFILDMSRNAFKNFVNFSAPNLYKLDMSQCQIDSLTATSLIYMPSLLELNVSSNRIERVPGNMTSRSLRRLDLSYCRLAFVTNATFQMLPQLRILNLTGNRFTKPFNKSMFASNTELTSLLLRDNPWRCDCDSQEFQSFAEFVMVMDPTEVTDYARCASPDHLLGKTWHAACYEQWYPLLDPQTSVKRYGVAMVAVFAIAGGLLIVYSAVRKTLEKRRKERHRQQEEEMERQLRIREREMRRRLQDELRDDDDHEVGWPRSRPHRSPSEITQPPSYEEALLLSRSQQDLLDRRHADAPSAAVAAVSEDDQVAPPASAGRYVEYTVEVEPPPKSAQVPSTPDSGELEDGEEEAGAGGISVSSSALSSPCPPRLSRRSGGSDASDEDSEGR